MIITYQIINYSVSKKPYIWYFLLIVVFELRKYTFVAAVYDGVISSHMYPDEHETPALCIFALDSMRAGSYVTFTIISPATKFEGGRQSINLDATGQSLDFKSSVSSPGTLHQKEDLISIVTKPNKTHIHPVFLLRYQGKSCICLS